MMPLSDTVDVASTGEAKDNDDISVTNAAGGVVLLEENKARKSALIINTGGRDMRVTTDGTDPTATRGKLVVPGAALNMSSPFCSTAVVKAFCENAEGTTANPSEVD